MTHLASSSSIGGGGSERHSHGSPDQSRVQAPHVVGGASKQHFFVLSSEDSSGPRGTRDAVGSGDWRDPSQAGDGVVVGRMVACHTSSPLPSARQKKNQHREGNVRARPSGSASGPPPPHKGDGAGKENQRQQHTTPRSSETAISLTSQMTDSTARRREDDVSTASVRQSTGLSDAGSPAKRNRKQVAGTLKSGRQRSTSQARSRMRPKNHAPYAMGNRGSTTVLGLANAQTSATAHITDKGGTSPRRRGGALQGNSVEPVLSGSATALVPPSKRHAAARYSSVSASGELTAASPTAAESCVVQTSPVTVDRVDEVEPVAISRPVFLQQQQQQQQQPLPVDEAGAVPHRTSSEHPSAHAQAECCGAAKQRVPEKSPRSMLGSHNTDKPLEMAFSPKTPLALASRASQDDSQGDFELFRPPRGTSENPRRFAADADSFDPQCSSHWKSPPTTGNGARYARDNATGILSTTTTTLTSATGRQIFFPMANSSPHQDTLALDRAAEGTQSSSAHSPAAPRHILAESSVEERGGRYRTSVSAATPSLDDLNGTLHEGYHHRGRRHKDEDEEGAGLGTTGFVAAAAAAGASQRGAGQNRYGDTGEESMLTQGSASSSHHQQHHRYQQQHPQQQQDSSSTSSFTLLRSRPWRLRASLPWPDDANAGGGGGGARPANRYGEDAAVSSASPSQLPLRSDSISISPNVTGSAPRLFSSDQMGLALSPANHQQDLASPRHSSDRDNGNSDDVVRQEIRGNLRARILGVEPPQNEEEEDERLRRLTQRIMDAQRGTDTTTTTGRAVPIHSVSSIVDVDANGKGPARPKVTFDHIVTKITFYEDDSDSVDSNWREPARVEWERAALKDQIPQPSQAATDESEACLRSDEASLTDVETSPTSRDGTHPAVLRSPSPPKGTASLAEILGNNTEVLEVATPTFTPVPPAMGTAEEEGHAAVTDLVPVTFTRFTSQSNDSNVVMETPVVRTRADFTEAAVSRPPTGPRGRPPGPTAARQQEDDAHQAPTLHSPVFTNGRVRQRRLELVSRNPSASATAIADPAPPPPVDARAPTTRPTGGAVLTPPIAPVEEISMCTVVRVSPAPKNDAAAASHDNQTPPKMAKQVARGGFGTATQVLPAPEASARSSPLGDTADPVRIYHFARGGGGGAGDSPAAALPMARIGGSPPPTPLPGVVPANHPSSPQGSLPRESAAQYTASTRQQQSTTETNGQLSLSTPNRLRDRTAKGDDVSLPTRPRGASDSRAPSISGSVLRAPSVAVVGSSPHEAMSSQLPAGTLPSLALPPLRPGATHGAPPHALHCRSNSGSHASLLAVSANNTRPVTVANRDGSDGKEGTAQPHPSHPSGSAGTGLAPAPRHSDGRTSRNRANSGSGMNRRESLPSIADSPPK